MQPTLFAFDRVPGRAFVTQTPPQIGEVAAAKHLVLALVPQRLAVVDVGGVGGYVGVGGGGVGE